MVGRKVDGPTQIVRPAPEGWQLWSRLGEVEAWTPEAEGSLEELAVAREAYLAIPARLVIAAPLWLPAADASTVQEMARMELDIRGLIPGPGEDVLNVKILSSGTDRVLIRAEIYSPLLPESLARSGSTLLSASPTFAELSAESVHLWREGSDVVMVFTRQDQPIYWETAPAKSSPAELSSWLERTGLTLMEEELILPPLGFVNFLPTQLPLPSYCDKDLKTPKGLPDLAAKLPACEWKSPQRRSRERQTGNRHRTLKVALLAGGAYFALLALFALWLGWQHWEVWRLRQTVREVEPAALALRQADRKWNALAGTVEMKLFPAEILYHVVEQMPTEGIRLTQFDLDRSKIGILGESKNVSAASQFLASLSKSTNLSHFDWEMSPPVLLPNNTARFVITGTLNHEED